MAANGDQNGYILNQVAVVAVPLPAHGHLNQLLHLSHLIASFQIPVHYVSFASQNRQAKLRAHGLDHTNSTINMINFHDPQFIPLPSRPPTPNNSTKFPIHIQCISEVCHLLRHPFSQLLRALSAKFRRIVVIYDSLMASVIQDVKSIPNAECYTFHTSSAFTIFFTIWQSMVEKPFQLGCDDIPKHVPSSQGCYSPEFEKFLANEYKLLNVSSGRLYNTCRSLESKYMELLTKLPTNENKKLFAIGPLNPLINNCIASSRSKHECLDWLDQQEKDSVIYVSFGTTVSMTVEQITELADGLDRSQQKFLWVLRDADKVDIFKEDEARKGHDVLLERYEERVKGRGLVIRDWAPQLEILGHSSTGGFVSHCGWNSCLESVSMGVPIVTWPMHSDQPKNSTLITKVLRVGVAVKDWDGPNDLITSNAVENAVRRLMTSTEGQGIRKRARELGAVVRSSAAAGGTSRLELDSFVAHITR